MNRMIPITPAHKGRLSTTAQANPLAKFPSCSSKNNHIHFLFFMTHLADA
jgi:hypothetical protein